MGDEAAAGYMAQRAAALLHFSRCSGVVQSVARQPLELLANNSKPLEPLHLLECAAPVSCPFDCPTI
jgi:hypothetical protein